MKEKAFTLAEVLITLGIIGVVAALTMPSLIAKYQEKVTITKLKKVYSVLSQVFQSAVVDNGNLDDWGFGTTSYDPAGGIVLTNHILPYLKVSKNCGTATGCYFNGYPRFLNGQQDGNNYNTDTRRVKIILDDGTLVVLATYYTTTTAANDPLYSASAATITVDINGSAPPNTWGKDLFGFFVINNGRVVPWGAPERENVVNDWYSFSTGCAAPSTARYGQMCGGWVLYNGNMDYLRCPTQLSWNGKTKCN